MTQATVNTCKFHLIRYDGLPQINTEGYGEPNAAVSGVYQIRSTKILLHIQIL
jgi:hypothetical protein